jgi:ferredoxin like protein
MEKTEEKKQLNLDDMLFTVRRMPLKTSHISIDKHFCKECLNRICTYICPAEVYVWDDAKKEIEINYENCLECGACRVACEVIKWTNPPWGTGIVYKNS